MICQHIPGGLRRAALAGCLLLAASRASGQGAPGTTLVPFRTEHEVAAYLREAMRAQRDRPNTSWTSAASTPSCTTSAVATLDSSGRGQGAAEVRGRVWSAGLSPATAGLSAASVTAPPFGAASTEADGSFAIRVPAESLAGPRTLTVTARRIGFAGRSLTATVQRGDRTHLSLPLCHTPLQLSEAVITGGATSRSVTNNQEAGVDEGDIVKRHGEYLVILRRGRLFTVDVRPGRLRPVAAVDAFGPSLDPSDAWFDELLVWGEKVVVVGYSYARGGTELGVFELDRAGGLRHLDTYQLRSDDYYSSRNYAARLVGQRLVFYAPLGLDPDAPRPLDALPALRRWRSARDTAAFRSTAAPRRVFRPAGRADPSGVEVLHTVTTCDLATPSLACTSTVVPGAEGRVFYVSPSAVYVWSAAATPPPVAGRSGVWEAPAMLTRLPLDGGAPSALRVQGSPVDQFSLLERGGHLNVLVQAHGRGDGMWHAEAGRVRGGHSLALLRVPLAHFGDGRGSASPAAYRPLPAPDTAPAAARTNGGAATVARPSLPLHNRFVGDHLLYGVGNGWGRPVGHRAALVSVPVRGGRATMLPMEHGIDRIEPLGRDALVVGSDATALHFTAVRLGARPALAQRFVRTGASQGELRSHGFFYRPDDASGNGGVLGIPVRGPGHPGYKHLFEESASVLFLRNYGRAFRVLGELPAASRSAADDACAASCVDWYGNARPLFTRARVFALLGYELVEGRLLGSRLAEVRRVDFTPRSTPRSPSPASNAAP